LVVTDGSDIVRRKTGCLCRVLDGGIMQDEECTSLPEQWDKTVFDFINISKK
jgi:hypothetical protein